MKFLNLFNRKKIMYEQEQENTVTETPAQEAKDSVHDFESAVDFVAHGLVSLGEAAKDELVILAKKYL